MTWLSVNPDSEPYNRLRLAADIQGKWSVESLTPQEVAQSYNLIEKMGCELPPPNQSATLKADWHDGDEED
jgi:hypothetical protein